MTINYDDIININISNPGNDPVIANRIAQITTILYQIQDTPEGQILFQRIQDNVGSIDITNVTGTNSIYDPATDTLNIDWAQLAGARIYTSDGIKVPSINSTIIHELFHAGMHDGASISQGAAESTATQFENDFMDKYFSQEGRIRYDYFTLGNTPVDVPYYDAFNLNSDYDGPDWGKGSMLEMLNATDPWYEDFHDWLFGPNGKADGTMNFFAEHMHIGDINQTIADLGGSSAGTETIVGEIGGEVISFISDAAETVINGTTYVVSEIADALASAANTSYDIIAAQVGAAAQWFTAGGAQTAFAEWLGMHVADLVNGNLDADDAFIDLAQFLGGRFISHEYIEGFTTQQANNLFNDVLTQEFGLSGADATALSSNFAVALTRMAVDFAVYYNEWDGDQLLNSAITVTTAVVSNHIASQLFSSSTSVSATVAAATTIINGLFNSDGYNSGDWVLLGVQTGVAVASAAASAEIGALIGSAIPGVGTVIGAAIGQILGSLIGSLIQEDAWRYENIGYNINTNHMEVIHVTSDESNSAINGAVSSLTNQYLQTVNNIIDSIGGRVDASDFQIVNGFIYDHAFFGYHHGNESAAGNDDFKVTLGHGSLYVNAGGDFSKIVRIGVEYELSKISFLGGNIIMNRAFELWKAHLDNYYATNTSSDSYADYLADLLAAGQPAQTPITLPYGGQTIATLATYLGIADQYTYYLENQATINTLITADPNGEMAQAWVALLLQASTLGLTGGYVVGYVPNNDSAATFYGEEIITAEGNDLIYADAGNDTVYAYGGSDIVYGGDGDDTIYAGAGADRIYADNGNDTIYGGDGIDEVFGYDGNDTIYGEGGDDLLAGENGNDTIYGGAGNDVIYTDGPGFAGNDTAHGGAGDDLIRAGASNDTVNGDDGDDEIYGDEGDDTITGGAGNDFINAGSGNDTAHGGGGNDTILGYEGNDTLNGNDGDDLLYGLSGADIITGGLGADIIYGDTGNDTLSGNEGNDIIDGWDGTDTLNGGTGSDTIIGGDDSDNIDGSDGDDTIYGDRRPDPNALPSNESAVLAMIPNNPGYDNWGLLYQGPDYTLAQLKATQHEMLIINPSKDSITNTPSSEVPWTAAEIAEIQGAGKVVIGYVNLAKINSFWDDWDSSWTTSGVGTGELTSNAPSWLGAYESSTTRLVDFTDSGWQNLVKGRIDDMIDQGFNGTLLDDVLEYYFRVDSNLTGTAFEQAVSDNAEAMRDFIIDLRAHADAKTVSVYGSNAHLHHFQLIVNGAPYILRDAILNDNILTSSENQGYLDAIDAIMTENFFSRGMEGAIDDTITFFGDNGVPMLALDTDQVTQQQRIQIITDAVNNGFMPYATESASYGILNGTFLDELDDVQVAGDDHITGGNGADTIYGGGGIDTVYYLNSSTGVTVNLATNVNTGGEAQGDVLAEIENVSGSAYNDSLTGDSQANWLYGNAGDDTLIGGDGDDVLIGGLGSDYMDGGNGVDTVSYANSSVFVSSDLAANNHWSGEASWDSIVNVENLIGSDFNDLLKGNSNANMLIGGLGNDELHGQDGDDILVGGAGNDNIYAGNGNDIIIGGAGSDYVDGGNGVDTLSYEGSTAGVNSDLGVNNHWSGDASWDSVANVENLTGSDYNDTLAGTNGANTLIGSAGNDALYGRDGDDILIGGAGNDNLYGGGHNDVITGGLGVDYLEGGSGDDTFAFTSLSDSLIGTADYIGDFVLGQDMIDVRGLGFTSIISGSTLSAGQLGFYSNGSDTVVTDGNGFGFAIAGNHTLTNDDVVFA